MPRLALALVLCFVGAAHGFGGDDGDQQAESLDSLAAPLRPSRRRMYKAWFLYGRSNFPFTRRRASRPTSAET